MALKLNSTYSTCYCAVFFVSVLCLILFQYSTVIIVKQSCVCPSKSTTTILNTNHTNQYTLKKAPPVIFQPQGGLGNQLFEYAAAYSLAKQRNSDLYICLQNGWNNFYLKVKSVLQSNANEQSYALNNFKIPHNNIIIEDYSGCKLIGMSNIETYKIKEDDVIFEKLQLHVDKILHLTGFMQSEIFFKPYKTDILRLFTLNPISENRFIDAISLNITQTESVAIHVRRGDYGAAGFGVLPISYYNEAIKMMKIKVAEKYTEKKNIVFFVFSDDIESVKEDFKNLTSENFIFVSNRHSSRISDFMLMSICKHNIIGNSTFSWWAAYLNRNQDNIVIAPLPKFDTDGLKIILDFIGGNRKYINQVYGGVWTYPYRWITIDPFKH